MERAVVVQWPWFLIASLEFTHEDDADLGLMFCQALELNLVQWSRHEGILGIIKIVNANTGCHAMWFFHCFFFKYWNLRLIFIEHMKWTQAVLTNIKSGVSSHRHPSASTLLYNVTNGGEPPPEVGERESLLIMRQQQLQALWIEWGHKSKTDQSSDGGLGRCWFYSKEWQTTLHWRNARTPAVPSRSFSIPVFVRNKLCSLFLASPLSGLGRCII